MQSYTSSVGERLRQAREERGLKQWQLAERAGITTQMVSLVERGKRGLTIPTVTALASALGVTTSWLLDKRERLEQSGGNRGILSLRDAILTSDDLPGLSNEHGEPVPLPVLERKVAEGWQMYWEGRFGDLAEHLPLLITGAIATEREAGTAACRPLAQAYQLAADLFVHVGSDDMAFGVARRALRAADRSGDPLQYAAVAGTLSWVSLHQDRHEFSEQVARKAAENIEPSGKVLVKHLTVYGGLLLSAAAPAAAAGRAGAVADYMAEAQLTVLRYPDQDRLDYNCNFGRTQLEMQRAHQLATLEQPAGALTAARKVVRADLRPISWGALNLDIAHAHLRMGKPAKAVDALLEAFAVSPVWARHQGLWRDSALAAVQAARRADRTEELRKAAGFLISEPAYIDDLNM